MTNNVVYSIIGFVILILVILYQIIKRKKIQKKIINDIKERWGKDSIEKFSVNELQSVSSHFTNLFELKKSNSIIDETTWHDLDMDNVFMRVCNTCSSIGDEFLYTMLRSPSTDSLALKEKNNLICFFQNNPTERIKVQYFLTLLGKKKHLSISDYFYSDEKDIPTNGKLYILLAGIFLFSPLLLLLNINFGIIAIMTMVIVNVTVYYRKKRELSYHLEALSYIVNMFGCANKLSGVQIAEIKEYREILCNSTKKLKSLTIGSFYSLFYGTGTILEYFKVVLLGELIAFDKLFRNIYKYRADLRKIFETIGYLDSLISIASYRESIPYYSIPALHSSSENSATTLSFKEIYHPLIKNPVPNTAEFSKPALITGSNASGKSTFLKTIAINAVFAQTISTSLAKEYLSSYFMLFTSMALKDSIENNESYYIAEIKSLKRILDALNVSTPCLCLIDEVLRGTNTIERIAASSEILFSLGKSNCLPIAATHDIELTSILKNNFDNYHFEESFNNDEIVFDYKLHSGKSNTRNAIKLLRFMGYNEEIIKNAEKSAIAFADDRTWIEKT